MTFVICEAGVNHNGDVHQARLLVEAAKLCGADAVKFQMFSSKDLWGDDRIYHLELKPEDYETLKDDCDDIGIEFVCTPFGVPELEFLAPLLKRIKIASGCIAKHELLLAASLTGLPIILSTGMATYPDIRAALSTINRDDVTLLHCTSAYPAPLSDVNLRAMQSMKALGYKVGYSDHTTHAIVPCYAVVLGATVIEAHITLDISQEGPDHKASYTPEGFAALVEHIRGVETIMGSAGKFVQPSEVETHKAWR